MNVLVCFTSVAWSKRCTTLGPCCVRGRKGVQTWPPGLRRSERAGGHAELPLKPSLLLLPPEQRGSFGLPRGLRGSHRETLLQRSQDWSQYWNVPLPRRGGVKGREVKRPLRNLGTLKTFVLEIFKIIHFWDTWVAQKLSVCLRLRV